MSFPFNPPNFMQFQHRQGGWNFDKEKKEEEVISNKLLCGFSKLILEILLLIFLLGDNYTPFF